MSFMQQAYPSTQVRNQGYQTAAVSRGSYQSSEYRFQEVMGASPIRLVIMSYDVAIQACQQRDFSRATRAISVLRDALNFDYDETAMTLFGLYQWCLDCIRKDDYQEAVNILTDLRDAWVTAEQQIASGENLEAA
jgi:flagellin-specific chaperone FliS